MKSVSRNQAPPLAVSSGGVPEQEGSSGGIPGSSVYRVTCAQGALAPPVSVDSWP